MIDWKANAIITVILTPLGILMAGLGSDAWECYFIVLFGLAWCAFIDWAFRRAR